MAVLTGDFRLDLVALLVTVIVTIYLYFQWSYQYWKRKNIPYLEGFFPFGSIESPFKKTAPESLAEKYSIVKEKGLSER